MGGSNGRGVVCKGLVEGTCDTTHGPGVSTAPRTGNRECPTLSLFDQFSRGVTYDTLPSPLKPRL